MTLKEIHDDLLDRYPNPLPKDWQMIFTTAFFLGANKALGFIIESENNDVTKMVNELFQETVDKRNEYFEQKNNS